MLDQSSTRLINGIDIVMNYSPVKALSRGLENLGVLMPSYLVFSVLMIRYKIGIFSEISLIGLRNRSHFAELAFQCLTPKGV